MTDIELWTRILKGDKVAFEELYHRYYSSLFGYALRLNFDEETIKENYAYYEKRTLHGSSLSPSIFSVMGLKVGDDSKAYRYLRRAAFIDLLNMQGNTREGIHAANTGGVWQTIVFGFAGVAQREDGMLKVHPNMPKEWQGLTFRLHYRGAWLEITADGSNQAKVIRLAGEPVEAEINGKVTTI